ncbi:hypothetical protein V9T40_000085 [Parthenolecanium corni]|uniref:Reverse transcriptase Ty1/copia-type domain-containing protein n=1 Tax=Parthenolecanium corni TaxID=536013 RepID=A0AAN9Y2T7_9HEMI
MKKEIASSEKNGTWEEVELPHGKKALDVKWVRKKPDGTFKARLVVRGFQQNDDLDDIYSPVARMCTLKLLLSYCCQGSYTIHQMDVETAFLNGPKVSEVYVKQPVVHVNINDNGNKVSHLKKSLNGLKESPRNWYKCFNNFIVTSGFERNNFDCSLYSTTDKVNPIFIILFVDDLLICGKEVKKINQMKRKLSEYFSMKDLNNVSSYLGIELNHDVENNVMTLSQEKYIESLATKYNIKDLNLFDTHIETHLKLKRATEPDFNVEFRNLIGALLYVSAGTRPDVTYSVNYLSRFQAAYDRTHYNYASRVLKYLYKTRKLKLTFCSSNLAGLDVYVDSDWAGDAVDRSNPVLGKTQKRGHITKLSTHTEYISLSEAVTEVIYLLGVCKQLLPSESIQPVSIFEDNLGAVCIANLGNFTKKSKHIGVHYHFVHEAIKRGQIEVVKVDSADNLADIFTKSLTKHLYVNLRILLCLC